MPDNSFDFDNFDFAPDQNNALGDTGFTPAFDFDEFEPEDFNILDSTTPEFELPDFGVDEPIFEFEPPQSNISDPILEFEPEFELDEPNFGLDTFDPLFLPEALELDDRLLAEPGDDLTFPAINDDLAVEDLTFPVVTNNRPIFKPISIKTDGIGSFLNDSLTGSTASNDINGLGGNDIIDGLGGNDRLLGGTGDDLLRGGTGNDRLIGTSPTDIFAGRGELDGLLGGFGADEFVLGDSNGAYYLGDGSATIWDFNARAGDSIQLTGSAGEYSLEENNLGNTNIFRGTDLIAVVYDIDVVPTSSLDFV